MSPATYSKPQANNASTLTTTTVVMPTRAKSSIQAPSTMPPQTNTVPGSTGSTVPAKPSKIKATHNIHKKVITKIGPRGQNRARIDFHVGVSD
jgi:hypothetical protein